VPGNLRVPRLSPSKKGDATRCQRRSLSETGESVEEDISETLRFATGEELDFNELPEDAQPCFTTK
jgi:hypothetical protein